MIQNTLNICHEYLMKMGFPYHSVSVIHRHQDLGFHVMFMDSVEEKITDNVKRVLKDSGFTYSIIKSK